MTIAQNAELQIIIRYFSTLSIEQIETAFAERWQPFILSLANEEDRVEAFQILYEWQIKQTEILAEHVVTLPTPAQKEGKKAAA